MLRSLRYLQIFQGKFLPLSSIGQKSVISLFQSEISDVPSGWVVCCISYIGLIMGVISCEVKIDLCRIKF